MLKFAKAIGASKIMFSPFQRTTKDGFQPASMVSPKRYLSSLEPIVRGVSASFVENDERVPAIIGQLVGMAAERGRNLGFDGLPQ
jgi:hypothetical protein